MKQTTAIRKQLTANEIIAGEWRILRNAQPVGLMFRERSAYGLCLVVELGDTQVSAGRSIDNALDAAAVHIWRAEHAAEDAEAQAAAADRAEMRSTLYQF